MKTSPDALDPLSCLRRDRAIPDLGTEVAKSSFRTGLVVEQHQLANGLRFVVLADEATPVASYQTWFSAGSRHELPGKTGLAHLLEHMMFCETERLAAGELHRIVEDAGGICNANTWLDWTQYSIDLPAEEVFAIPALESERMSRLALRAELVARERAAVINERRQRAGNADVRLRECLWGKAFTAHPYRWPTLGWAEDLPRLTAADCATFYERHYAPENATVVVAGRIDATKMLRSLEAAYGALPRRASSSDPTVPEPPQEQEITGEIELDVRTSKLAVGYKSPGMADADHWPLLLLNEILLGGPNSRGHRILVEERSLATRLHSVVSSTQDPGLLELVISLAGSQMIDEVLAIMEGELQRIQEQNVSDHELDRARGRLTLVLLKDLESAAGKARSLGFSSVVFGRAFGMLEGLSGLERVTADDLRRVARRYLRRDNRTVVVGKPGRPKGAA